MRHDTGRIETRDVLIIPAGNIKAHWNHYVLNDSTAGSRGNTPSSVGAFESLWNHCKQHLVALFAPAPPLRGGKRDHGTRANTCTMTVRQLRAQGDVDRVFLSFRKHCVSCRTYRATIHVNSRAPRVRSLLTGHRLPLRGHRFPLMGHGLPLRVHRLSLMGNGLPLRGNGFPFMARGLPLRVHEFSLI